MPATTRIIAIGNSAGIVLPKEILDRLKLRKGDTVALSETPIGLYLTPHDDQRRRKLESADRIMRGYRDAPGKLAE